MKREFLTVFTPAYNRAKTLPRTYESLKNQSCKEFVWLIVDDGSQDNTRELVQEWQKKENSLLIMQIALISQFANAVFLINGEGWKNGTPFTFFMVLGICICFIFRDNFQKVLKEKNKTV